MVECSDPKRRPLLLGLTCKLQGMGMGYCEVDWWVWSVIMPLITRDLNLGGVAHVAVC